MNHNSALGSLQMDASEDFSVTVENFEKRARDIRITGSALLQDDTPIDAWRTLCEAMDMLAKRTDLRVPLTKGWCTSCGSPNMVPTIEGVGMCKQCGGGTYVRMVRCRCGLTGGLRADMDSRTTQCQDCGTVGLELIDLKALLGRRSPQQKQPGFRR